MDKLVAGGACWDAQSTAFSAPRLRWDARHNDLPDNCDVE